MNKLKYSFCALVLSFTVAGSARAQAPSTQPTAPSTPPTTPSPPATTPAASGAPSPEPAAAIALSPGKGLSITSGDKRAQLLIRSRIQLRASYAHDPKLPQEDSLEAQVRTLRFSLGGYVLVPELKYAIQLAFGAGDFEKDSSSPIFDAFVEYTKLRDLNVRVGQFFVPFDRARTIREFALQFVDRQGVVRELSLDRDVGVMLSSQDLFGLYGVLAYNLFVGGGDGRNRIADVKNAHGPQKPGVLVIGRLTVRPFGPFDDDQEGDLTRTPKPRLALGIAGGINVASNRDKSTYGATYTLGTFNYTHAAADLVFKWHGFSLLTEFLYRHADERQHLPAPAADGTVAAPERSRSGHGWFVQAGQLVTSQLELTGRFEQLTGTSPAVRADARKSGRQVGGGLNLYLNGHAFKLQTDYFYVFGSNELSQGAHVARLQLDASF